MKEQILATLEQLHRDGKVIPTQHGLDEVTVSPAIFRQLEKEIENPEQRTKLQEIFMLVPDGSGGGYWVMMTDKNPFLSVASDPVVTSIAEPEATPEPETVPKAPVKAKRD